SPGGSVSRGRCAVPVAGGGRSSGVWAAERADGGMRQLAVARVFGASRAAGRQIDTPGPAGSRIDVEPGRGGAISSGMKGACPDRSLARRKSNLLECVQNRAGPAGRAPNEVPKLPQAGDSA